MIGSDTRGVAVAEPAPPLDEWLSELGIEVVGAAGDAADPAFSRDVVLDGDRRFDLRVTIAWVGGVGLSLWAYYGLEAMEIPRRILHGMLRANFELPFVKFGITDDGRPMLMTELPAAAASSRELARGLVRLLVVSDRLLEETAMAVADRGQLPDWSGRATRNPALMATFRAEVEGEMPAWEPPVPRPPRRGLIGWLRGSAR